jgi:glucose-6-phosphate isomerase
MSVTKSLAWQNLVRHKEALGTKTSADLIADEPERLKKYEIAHEGLRFNFACQHASAETLMLLTELARQQDVAGWRTRMFAGDKINQTENRAVLHTALRRRDATPLRVEGVDIMPALRAVQARMAAFVEEVRSGTMQGVTGKKIRTVVNIGIGGSDLGPRLVTQALCAFKSNIDVLFVANADGFDLQNAVKDLDPGETLFVVASKTFTSQETLLNAQRARQWLVEKLGRGAVEKHFVAVSANSAEVEKFGIPASRLFPLWDWVGGRFSLWSAVGLSITLAIGHKHFADLLVGAETMDAHFLSAPLASNMPVMMAMLGIWNRNFLDAPALAILPYSERLRDLPRFLQQLEMESNGKSVTRAGVKTDYETAPALFGDCGTVGQHSFHQWLHQGTTAIPADFIAVAADDLNEPQAHRALLSNLAAQMTALTFGQNQAAAQDTYPGSRSSNLVMLAHLDPYRLGMLIALYEHKVFVQGVIWELNSFDQPGVELGKRMAKGLDPHTAATPGKSPETAFLNAFFDELTR